MHVLIVARYDAEVDGLAAHLTNHGLATEVREEEADALSVLEACHHEVVLIDSRLSASRLSYLVENIRRIQPDARIAFLATPERPSALNWAIQMGISWYAFRPFDKDALVSQIQKEARQEVPGGHP